ncbi:MAG: hypothetical protein ACYC6J_09090 [Coriobacteriia bacterium]
MTSVDTGEIPDGLLLPLIALSAIQIVVQILAFVRLARTPVDRLVFGRRWPWALVILMNLVGAVVFLAAARKPAEATDPLAQDPGPADGGRAVHAVDVLYGPRDGGS